jgi:hypothetical protein
MAVQVFIMPLLLPLENSFARGSQLLRDNAVDTAPEVFLINKNFLDIDQNKLDRTGTIPAAKLTIGSATITGPLYLVGFTTGSVLFIGDGQQVTQDNANLFWDSSNDRLGISTNTPSTTLDVHGNIECGVGDCTISGKRGIDIDYATSAFAEDSLRYLQNGEEVMRISKLAVAIATDVPHGHLTVGGGTLVVSSSAATVSIGNLLTPPDGTLHVHRQTAGSVTANANADELIIENNGNTGLSFLSPATAIQAIYFGDANDDNVGYIQYLHSDDIMQFTTNQVLNLRIEADGDLNIQVVGAADAELEVSNGATTGGGTVHAASFANHSSEQLKSDIRSLSEEEYNTSYQNAKNLLQYEFRYKVRESTTSARLVRDVSQPLWRGPMYETSPAELQGRHETISLNDRILQLEMALKIAIQKIESLEEKDIP